MAILGPPHIVPVERRRHDPRNYFINGPHFEVHDTFKERVLCKLEPGTSSIENIAWFDVMEGKSSDFKIKQELPPAHLFSSFSACVCIEQKVAMQLNGEVGTLTVNNHWNVFYIPPLIIREKKNNEYVDVEYPLYIGVRFEQKSRKWQFVQNGYLPIDYWLCGTRIFSYSVPW
jgi:hypothetical protein